MDVASCGVSKKKGVRAALSGKGFSVEKLCTGLVEQRLEQSLFEGLRDCRAERCDKWRREI